MADFFTKFLSWFSALLLTDVFQYVFGILAVCLVLLFFRRLMML